MWQADKVLVAEAFTDGAVDQGNHLVDGIEGAEIMASLELPDVAEEVFGTHVVVDAVEAALEQSPMGFDAVGIDIAADIFAGAMGDGLVLTVDTLVG